MIGSAKRTSEPGKVPQMPYSTIEQTVRLEAGSELVQSRYGLLVTDVQNIEQLHRCSFSLWNTDFSSYTQDRHARDQCCLIRVFWH